jgi:sporulation protein YlmC with PRC-barrel domain
MKCVAVAAIALMVAAPAMAQNAPGTDSTAPNPQANSSAPVTPSQASANANRFLTNVGQDQWLVGNLWNKSVYNAAGKSIGDLKDVLIDHDGKVVAVVVGVGGFLGLGEKNVAVDFNYLEKNGGVSPNRIVLNMSEQDLRSAPDFRRPSSNTSSSH